jgi:hypothetical protein
MKIISFEKRKVIIINMNFVINLSEKFSETHSIKTEKDCKLHVLKSRFMIFVENQRSSFCKDAIFVRFRLGLLDA